MTSSTPEKKLCSLVLLSFVIGCGGTGVVSDAGPLVDAGPSTKLVDLTVTEPSGNALSPARVRSGIPLPKGLLRSTDAVTLFSAAEQILPTQVASLSEWDDGSIRWLLVDAEVPLAANESATLSLRTLDTPSPIAGTTIDIQESAEFITVDTGSLKIEVPRLYGGVIHRAWVDNTLVIDAPTVPTTDRGAFISVFDSTDSSTRDHFSGLLRSTSTPRASDPIKSYLDRVAASGDADYNLHDPWHLDAQVEENGPLHSVVRISGTHLDSTGMGFSTFVVRLHFYRGSNTIRVAHTMIYTGDETQQIKTYGLRLPLSAAGESTLVEGAAGLGEVRHIGYSNFEVNGGQQAGQAMGTMSRTHGANHVRVVLRDMAEHFPKALVANASGLEVQLYPTSASPWDLTKYIPPPADSDFAPGTYPYLSQIATKQGETTRFTNHLFLRGAQGLSTSDDYEITFAPGAPDAAITRAQAEVIDQGPIMLVPAAAWVSDAAVMGIGPFDFTHDVATAEGHYRIDRVLKIVRDFMRVNQRKQFGWYGIENYGDIRGRFFGSERVSATWHKKGRYGWSGNSGEPSNQLWVQYLRKPTQLTFLDAEALARHSLDQQTVHFATSSAQGGTELDGRNMFGSVGSMHRHGVQAWSGYAGSPDYSHVAGIETYYYLTGDRRAKEALYEQGQFIVRQSSARTGIKNGLEVVDRAAAVFFDQPALAAQFEAKAVVFVNYLQSDPDGFGYNAVQTRLIDGDRDGSHDFVQGRLSKRGLFAQSFEYFMRGAPGMLYRHERTGDAVVGRLILDAADVLTKGDPAAPANTGDDWDLGLDGHAGSFFYHINSLSYAAHIATSLAADGTEYYALAKRCVENNTHAGTDTNDTAPIPLAVLQTLPDDWAAWRWLWQEGTAFDAANPGILWLARIVTYRNNTLQDYHSYRTFIHLSTGASMVAPGELVLR